MPQAAEPQALVAFGGCSELPWLRLLRPGFRHCFLLRRHAAGWLLYDPRSDRTELTLWPPCGAQPLINALKERGYIVVPAAIPPESRQPAPLGLFTCVEAVKRVLGIRRRWLLTPWQLYRWLTQRPF